MARPADPLPSALAGPTGKKRGRVYPSPSLVVLDNQSVPTAAARGPGVPTTGKGLGQAVLPGRKPRALPWMVLGLSHGV